MVNEDEYHKIKTEHIVKSECRETSKIIPSKLNYVNEKENSIKSGRY